MNFEKGIKEAKNAATLLRLLIMLDGGLHGGRFCPGSTNQTLTVCRVQAGSR